MWLCNQNDQNIHQYVMRLIGIALLGGFLAACSDISIHQLGKDNQDSLRKIIVIDFNTREGQLYARELRKNLHIGGKSDGAYELTSTIITSSAETLSVQGAGSNLKKMSMTASFLLTDLNTGKTLFENDVVGDATIGAVTSLYGQDKSESHARDRLAILLAQRVVRHLQFYFLEQYL